MQSANGKPPAGLYLLAGLQAGMLAALCMLLWLGLVSQFYQRSFWTVPNLFSSTFHGEAALRQRFVSTTWSGLAVYLVAYSLLGAVFAAAVQLRWNRLRIALIGILVAIAWYYLSFGVIWRKVNPLVVLYTHDRPMFLGHVLYGAMLSRFPRYLKRLWKPPEPPAVPTYGSGSTDTIRESD